MKVKYPGPHRGVVIEDVATGFTAEVERGGEIDVPDRQVAERLIEQGFVPATTTNIVKPAAKTAKED